MRADEGMSVEMQRSSSCRERGERGGGREGERESVVKTRRRRNTHAVQQLTCSYGFTIETKNGDTYIKKTTNKYNNDNNRILLLLLLIFLYLIFLFRYQPEEGHQMYCRGGREGEKRTWLWFRRKDKQCGKHGS